jgi:hypothetical protein
LSIPKSGLADVGPWFDVRLSLGRTVLAILLPGPSFDLGAFTSDGVSILARPGYVHTGFEHSFQLRSEELAAISPPSHEEIAVAAYYRSLSRAPADGTAESDWLEAEQDLLWKQIGIESHERPT